MATLHMDRTESRYFPAKVLNSVIAFARWVIGLPFGLFILYRLGFLKLSGTAKTVITIALTVLMMLVLQQLL